MYLNFCTYLQSWNSHLTEMDNLPLSPVSKDFCGYKGHYKSWESQAKGKRQEPFAGRSWQQLPRDPCGTAVTWLCRTARDAAAKFVSAATSPPIISMAMNRDYPTRIATPMIQSQKKNHVQTTLICPWLKSPCTVYPCCSTQWKMHMCVYMYGTDPTYTQQ